MGYPLVFGGSRSSKIVKILVMFLLISMTSVSKWRRWFSLMLKIVLSILEWRMSHACFIRSRSCLLRMSGSRKNLYAAKMNAPKVRIEMMSDSVSSILFAGCISFNFGDAFDFAGGGAGGGGATGGVGGINPVFSCVLYIQSYI